MGSTIIKSVHARQLIDCKCRPVVEVDVITEGGALGRGSAPTGTSVGMHEAFVLRDNDPREYGGLGVRKAVENVNQIIAPALTGMDCTDQAGIDRKMIELDGTDDKHNLGGNAVYSVSVACLRAAARASAMPVYQYIAGQKPATVPVPSFNVINGGKNGSITQAFNEFLIVPYRAATCDEAVEMGVQIFNRLGGVIERHTGQPAMVGRSYGWCAPSEDPEAVLGLMQQAIDECGYTGRCAFALDCAASEMYDSQAATYYLKGQQVTSAELIQYAKRLTERWDFVFIEDLLDENDWDGYALAHQTITRTLLIADDLTVSNKQRIIRANQAGSIDGFILKPNQIGTITEAMEAHQYAAEHGLLSITSGRSGGVLNDIVMDLAVGLQLPFIKNGCPRSGERIEKLNFLLRVCDCFGCSIADLDKLVRF